MMSAFQTKSRPVPLCVLLPTDSVPKYKVRTFWGRVRRLVGMFRVRQLGTKVLTRVEVQQWACVCESPRVPEM